MSSSFDQHILVSLNTTPHQSSCDPYAGLWRSDSMTDDEDHGAVPRHAVQHDDWPSFVCRAGPSCLSSSSSSPQCKAAAGSSHQHYVAVTKGLLACDDDGDADSIGLTATVGSSFQPHSHGADLDPLGDVDVAAHLFGPGADGCCSSDDPSEREEDGCGGAACSGMYDALMDSPTPEYLPGLDWAGLALDEDVTSNTHHRCPSPTGAVAPAIPSPSSPLSNTGSSDGEDRDRRRYRRGTVSSGAGTSTPAVATRPPPPPLDYHQQRLIIDAERARRREDINARMSQQQQLGPSLAHIALKVLCNEAHRRHVAQIEGRRRCAAANSTCGSKDGDAPANAAAVPSFKQGAASPPPPPSPSRYTASFTSLDGSGCMRPPSLVLGSCTPTSSSSNAAHLTPSVGLLSDDNLQCVASAWANVAECVEESLFFPAAVQARLSCMGIFRNAIKVGDLLCYDDHEDERTAIRMRQQQIINILRCQSMAGRNPCFLEKPFDYGNGGLASTTHSSSSMMLCDGRAYACASASPADDECRLDEEDQYSPTAFIPMGDF